MLYQGIEAKMKNVLISFFNFRWNEMYFQSVKNLSVLFE